MPASGIQDAEVEYLIQELALPIGGRRAATQAEFHRSLDAASNRRDGQRVSLIGSELVVRVDDEVVNGVDLSLRGLQFRVSRRLAPGSSVVASLLWPGHETSAALSRVMWAHFERPSRSAEPHYRVGVGFENFNVRGVRALLERCGLGRNPDLHVVYSRL